MLFIHQNHLKLVNSRMNLREAEVADLARALAHENVEALEVPVRNLPPPDPLVSA